MNPTVISESDTEPIEVDEAVENVRANEDGDGETLEARLFARLIKTARQLCEEETEISLVGKTLELSLESFCSPHPRYSNESALVRYQQTGIELPNGPVRSIVSVKYTDVNGVEATLATDQYRLSTSSSTAVLRPAYGVAWPSTRREADAVRVRYTAGYFADESPPQLVPEPIRQAMHLCIAHFYANRDAVDVNTFMELPLGVRALLAKYRRGLGV